MFRERKPILSKLQPRPPSAHPGREALIQLPRPYTKHRNDIGLRRAAAERDKDTIDLDRFKYTPAESDLRVQRSPHSFLAIHILELSNISVRVTKFDKRAPMFFYCLVSIGTNRRMSKVVQSDTRHRVRMDSIIYFTTELSEERDDYRNTLRFELWAFQVPEFHYIIGTKDIHIYKIVQNIHGIESKKLWSEGLVAGTMIYEYAFAYGAFGFGHSDQLKNTDKSVYESVDHSMFPRVRLGEEDIVDNKFNIRVPDKLQTMSLNSFIFQTSKSGKYYSENAKPSETVEPRFFTVHQVEFKGGLPIYCKVNMNIYQKALEADFSDMYGEYVCLTGRGERIDYLRSLLGGRLDDLEESNVGPLFANLQGGVVEKTLETDVHSSKKVMSSPCTDVQPIIISKEDEKFLSLFPSTSFTPGWLSRVFGYEEESSDLHYGEGDYPIKEAKKLIRSELPCSNRFLLGLKYTWYRFTGLISRVFLFVFPELRRHTEIPEISVTLTSPEGSTTNLYTHWVNHGLQDPAHHSERNAKESNLVSLQVDKKAYEYDDDSNTESEEMSSRNAEFRI